MSFLFFHSREQQCSQNRKRYDQNKYLFGHYWSGIILWGPGQNVSPGHLKFSFSNRYYYYKQECFINNFFSTGE